MPRPDGVVGTPVARVNTTPLTVIGVAASDRLCEIQAGSSAKPLPASDSFRARTAPVVIVPLVDGTPAAGWPANGNSSHGVVLPALVGAEARARRVFWRDENDLAEQLGLWRGPRMARLVARLVELHRELLANSAAGETLLAQSLANLTRAARR